MFIVARGNTAHHVSLKVVLRVNVIMCIFDSLIRHLNIQGENFELSSLNSCAIGLYTVARSLI